jgi:RimJ/RimL family protein N-acetyltransferase
MTLSAEILAPTARERGTAALKTERLFLRAPCREDTAAIARLANDMRIAVNTARLPHPYRVEDAEEFIAAATRKEGEASFAITLERTLIGVCGVDPRADGPEIGYWLGVDHWGQGYATEAARALIDHAFGELGYEALQAGARVSNPASRRVLEKCGFQWVGVRLLRIRAINSAAPTDRFRLDRRLWQSLRSWGRVNRVA